MAGTIFLQKGRLFMVWNPGLCSVMEDKLGRQSHVNLGPTPGWIILKKQKETSLECEVSASFNIASLDSPWKCTPSPTASSALLGLQQEPSTPNPEACRCSGLVRWRFVGPVQSLDSGHACLSWK